MQESDDLLSRNRQPYGIRLQGLLDTRDTKQSEL